MTGLAGRSASDAYRGAALRCPACGETMHGERTPSAAVDVCGACEGLWLDWFEGEVETVAVEAELARLERGTPLPRRLDQPGADVSTTCPRCGRALVVELYRFGDARDHELVTGVEVLRCAECGGAFVPRGSAHLLLQRARESRTQTPWEALRAFLERWRRR